MSGLWEVKVSAKAIQVIALASGKGGVGKTQLCLNLGIALAAMGRRVAMMDADLSAGDLALAAGVSPVGQLGELLHEGSAPADIRTSLGDKLYLLASAQGDAAMARLGSPEHVALIHSLNSIRESIDFLLVDTASGLWESTINFAGASREVLIVLTEEPAAIELAFALIRELNLSRGLFRFRVISNKVGSRQAGELAFERLRERCDSALDVALHYLDCVPRDDHLRRAALRQQPVLMAAPEARSSAAIKDLAKMLVELPPAAGPRGGIEFFMEDLLSRDG